MIILSLLDERNENLIYIYLLDHVYWKNLIVYLIGSYIVTFVCYVRPRCRYLLKICTQIFLNINNSDNNNRCDREYRNVLFLFCSEIMVCVLNVFQLR